ncbi:hypothetical protein EJB05_14412, partial [Eragrostis curvula]
MPPPRPPPELMADLVADILLRIPPDAPADLFRAAHDRLLRRRCHIPGSSTTQRLRRRRTHVPASTTRLLGAATYYAQGYQAVQGYIPIVKGRPVRIRHLPCRGIGMGCVFAARRACLRAQPGRRTPATLIWTHCSMGIGERYPLSMIGVHYEVPFRSANTIPNAQMRQVL